MVHWVSPFAVVPLVLLDYYVLTSDPALPAVPLAAVAFAVELLPAQGRNASSGCNLHTFELVVAIAGR